MNQLKAIDTTGVCRSGLTQTPLLPHELWLAIFAWVPRATVSSLALTCAKFYHLTIPLLFGEGVTFSLGKISRTAQVQTSSELSRIPRERVTDNYARLTYLTAPRNMHRLSIKSMVIHGSRVNWQQNQVELAAILASLVHFPRLKSLTFLSVHLDWNKLNSLRTTSVKTLILDECYLDTYADALDNECPRPLEMPQLTMRNTRISLDSDQALVQVIHPSYIQNLKVDSSSTANAVLATIAAAISRNEFKALTALTIPEDTFSTAHFLHAVRNCPYITSIAFTRSFHAFGHDYTHSQPSKIIFAEDILPNLRSYSGPLSLLSPFIFHSRPIRTITLLPYEDATTRCFADASTLVWGFENALRNIHPRNPIFSEIEELNFGVSQLTRELFESVARTFPRLRKLGINAQSDTPGDTFPDAPLFLPSRVLSLLEPVENQQQPSLPETIRSLSIGLVLRSDLAIGMDKQLNKNEHFEGQVRDFATGVKIGTGCRHMDRVVVSSGDLDFTWRFPSDIGVGKGFVETTRVVASKNDIY